MNFSGETSRSKKQYSENLIQYLIDREVIYHLLCKISMQF